MRLIMHIGMQVHQRAGCHPPLAALMTSTLSRWANLKLSHSARGTMVSFTATATPTSGLPIDSSNWGMLISDATSSDLSLRINSMGKHHELV